MIARGLLEESVGVKDDIHAAHGSLSRCEFHSDMFVVYSVRLLAPTRAAIYWSLYLVRHDLRR